MTSELDRAVIDEAFRQLAFEQARGDNAEADRDAYKVIATESLQALYALTVKYDGLKVKYYTLLDERRVPRRAA